MNPPQCTHENEISAAVERWKEKYRSFREDVRSMELPDEWKMTALRMMLCGETQKSVEYREKDFKTYDDLRSVVMKWAINRKIESERADYDPMDCKQTQDCNTPEQWEWPASNLENSAPTEPTDVNYMHSKGKCGSKGGSKGGKGPGNRYPNSAAYYMAMAMKAMKGGGKAFGNQAGQ